MRRTLIGGSAVALLTACSGGSTPTSTPGGDPTVTLKGAITGAGRLSGEGAGHVCGQQGNGAYLASMRATVGDRQLVVQLQLGHFSGPSEYQLGSGGNDMTLTMETSANPALGSPTWVSDSGHVTV